MSGLADRYPRPSVLSLASGSRGGTSASVLASEEL
jgi:hypothetical protein